jgi:hypothetical protein
MPNIIIETGGTTASVATDLAQLSGLTTNFQIFKLGYGVTGSVTLVSSSNPLPVSVGATLSANITGFSGPMSVQGIASGTPLTVTGTVLAAGITGSPVYVKTFTGSQVEVTGGRYLSKTTDSVAVWGPNGTTYIYASLVDQSGNCLSYSNGALNVNVMGATINATIPSTVTVVGLSGATAVNVTVGNTVGINDTNIINGMTNIYSRMGVMGGTLDAIYNALAVFGLVRPTSVRSTVLSLTTASTVLGSGFTCAAGVNLKALGANTDLIYLGGTLLGASYGYQLEPGENVFLNVSNLNMIYAMSKSGTQTLSYFAS